MNKQFSIKKTWNVLKHAFKSWKDKDPFKESAVIAYYAIFSLPGLIVIAITLVGYFLGRDAASGQLYGQIKAMMGEETADQFQTILVQSSEGSNSVLAAVIGFGTLILGATGVFAQFQKSLNIIWEVKADATKSGIWTFIKVRLFSLGVVVSIAFLLLISFVITALLAALGEWVTSSMPDAVMVVFQVVNFFVSLIIVALLFGLMFKVLPDAKVKWRDVWIGGILTSLLFELGKTGLALYFGKADPASGYGAAGSIVLTLLWVSYTSMIVFFGAEFTKAFADQHGVTPPTENAVSEPGRQA